MAIFIPELTIGTIKKGTTHVAFEFVPTYLILGKDLNKIMITQNATKEGIKAMMDNCQVLIAQGNRDISLLGENDTILASLNREILSFNEDFENGIGVSALREDLQYIAIRFDYDISIKLNYDIHKSHT